MLQPHVTERDVEGRIRLALAHPKTIDWVRLTNMSLMIQTKTAGQLKHIFAIHIVGYILRPDFPICVEENEKCRVIICKKRISCRII